jgi:hypothetical protein
MRELQKRNRSTLVAIRTEAAHSKGKRGIRGRALQRGLSGRPRAPQEDWSRAVKTPEEEINDRGITVKDRFTRTEALLYAALRVRELKHGFGD